MFWKQSSGRLNRENGGSRLDADKKRLKKSHRIGYEKPVRKELGVHGQRWASIFDGYFSDPEAARPLVDAVERAIDASRPTVAADLGGGTGFVLAELLRRGLMGFRLVNAEVGRAARCLQ